MLRTENPVASVERRPTATLKTLTNLDGYMAAQGYSPDHPWRTEIAVAIAGGRSPAIDKCTLHDELDAIDCGVASADSLLSLALAECVSDGGVHGAEAAIRAARRYMADVTVSTTFLFEVSA